MLFDTGELTNLIGSYSFSIVRAMLSMCVTPNEFGKVNAFVVSVATLVMLVVIQIFASVWGVSKLIEQTK